MKSPAARGRQGEVENSDTNSNTAAFPPRQFAASPAGRAGLFGPWSPSVDPVEQIAQLRSLAALAAVSVGSGHELVAELRAAETERDAADRALKLLDALPSLRQRRLIATFGAITFRPRSTQGGGPDQIRRWR
jgi:hypothetical protein